ncbi:MAG: hypothetical protein VCC00_00035 [Deltaproteobacteria bacterium]
MDVDSFDDDGEPLLGTVGELVCKKPFPNMPMFLQLAEGVVLDAALERKVSRELREQCSPRHVPEKYYAIGEIPYTLTGKKLEVPVRKLLLGWPLEKAASRDSMMNPSSIDYFVDYVATTTDYQVPA